MLRDEYHDQFLILYLRSKQNDNTIVTANVKYINCFMIDSIENMKSIYSKIRVLENYDYAKYFLIPYSYYVETIRTFPLIAFQSSLFSFNGSSKWRSLKVLKMFSHLIVILRWSCNRWQKVMVSVWFVCVNKNQGFAIGYMFYRKFT